MPNEKLGAQEIIFFLKEENITNDQGQPLDFKNHAFLLDIYDDFSPKQAILKAAQIGFCLSPCTRILTSSYDWVSLNDIKVGTEIIAVDEEHNGNSHGRRMLIGVVEGKNEIREEAFEISLHDGRKLIATAQHRFLSQPRGGVETMWREVGKMKPGDTIRNVVIPWGRWGSNEDGWVGGALDGEAHLRKKSGCELTFVQRPGLVFDKMRNYLTKGNFVFREVIRNKSSTSKNPIGELTLSRTDDIIRLIGVSKPLRFSSRTDWWEGLCIPGNRAETSWIKIKDIKPLGSARMIDIQTSTKTFIAEGFVSHNSTMANIKALWLAKNRALDIIYSLPSAADIRDFVAGKTNRLISNNRVFQDWVADKDSIEQKRVGANVVYFRGTWTERAAIAIPADLYISDETDRSKQDIVQQYKTRLQHSKYAWEWYFSNPSVASESVGVNRYWVQSDQKHWIITCDCGKWQWLTMENIMGEPPYFGCVKCKKELDRRKGKWVQKHKNKEFSGYWISALMAPWISAQDILRKQKEYSEEQFYNFVLGLPYASKGNILSRQAFFQNLSPLINPQDTRPIIGVDTGVNINYVVGNSKGIFYFKKENHYEGIRALMRRWPKAICIIDQGGDMIEPRKLREEFPNRVFLCFLSGDRKNDELVKWNDEDGTVVIDRNKMIQMVVDEFTERRIPLNGSEADWDEVWSEWSGMYRTVEDNALGVPIYKWNKPATGRCDYPFSMVFWRVGMDRFADSAVKFVGESGVDSFASQGIEVMPNGKGFLAKNR